MVIVGGSAIKVEITKPGPSPGEPSAMPIDTA